MTYPQTMAFDEDQLTRIEACLEELLSKTKGAAVLLADCTGQPVGSVGTLSDKDRVALATLAAGSFAATVAMAKLLGQAGSFEQVFFEGEGQSVHSSTVSEDYLLTIAFDSRAKPGLVRLMAVEAVKELRDILSEAQERTIDESVRDLIDGEFGDSLADELDTLLS
jgi:predicted regulator of Ras-like GTPase activity (Roadblock/LC7/MglB family)